MIVPLPHYVGRFEPHDGELVPGSKSAPSGCVGASEGGLMLAGRREERSATAKLLGVSRQLLTMWASGARFPSEPARLAMPELLGIPEEAWTLWRPISKARAPSSSPAPLASVPDGASVVDRMRVAQGEVAASKSPEDLKLATGKLDALAKLARIEALAAKGRLHDHPDWAAMLDAVIPELTAIPGAVDAFVRGLSRAAEAGGAS